MCQASQGGALEVLQPRTWAALLAAFLVATSSLADAEPVAAGAQAASSGRLGPCTQQALPWSSCRRELFVSLTLAGWGAWSRR